MSESIDDKIFKSIKKRGRGIVFSTEEYAHYGDPDTVQKALSRMARKGTLLHICHGIYCYPKVDKKLGLGVLYPTFETIAQVIAKRDKVKIFPAGALAQNLLGLSTQVPMNVVYLTDGSSKDQKIGKTYTTDDKGIVTVDGLDWGKYYFIETKAPTGFNAVTDPVYFEITRAISAAS